MWTCIHFLKKHQEILMIPKQIDVITFNAERKENEHPVGILLLFPVKVFSIHLCEIYKLSHFTAYPTKSSGERRMIEKTLQEVNFLLILLYFQEKFSEVFPKRMNK